MCILYLQSENANFSKIIGANPDDYMQVKQVKKGYMFGYYQKGYNSKYMVYFADSDSDTNQSYKNPNMSLEYLNPLKYSSSEFVVNAIIEMFSNALRNNLLDVTGINHELFVNIVNIHNNTYDVITRIESFYKKFNVTKKMVAPFTYQLTVSSSETLKSFLNFCIIYFTIIAALNEDECDYSGNTLNKLLESINNIETPYYVRHIIISRILKNEKLFDRLRDSVSLNNSNLLYGNADIQRRNYIQKEISFDKPIIEIGCGNGFLTIPFANTLNIKSIDPKYYAVDIDNNKIISIKKQAKEEKLNNLYTFNNHKDLIYEIDRTKKFTIIINNIIEYLQKDEIITIFTDILLNLNLDKIIITIINKDFNKYYGLENNELRNPDHKLELNKIDLISLIDNIFDKDLNKSDYNIRITDVGDIVDNIPCMIGCIITKI